LRPAGSSELGTKTELKNMNSFRFLERGVEAEIARQAEILDAGGRVEQETLHFDPRTGSLTSLRSKEESHDYRYFPEPDLVPLVPTEEMIETARAALPELPGERRERYASELKLDDKPATQLAFDVELGAYFERVLAVDETLEPRVVANWITGNLAAALREVEGEPPEPEPLATLIAMVGEKRVSREAGLQILRTLIADGGDPAEIAEREGLGAIEDSGELEAIVERALEADPAAAERVREGNAKAIGPLVGFVMRETKGRADGGEVTKLIHAKLGI
jgi:aspartyl-tRNA(Asn)/glutamyl-tRNA(Gln) amidotransferase subunit B